jgi:hypothetical protein
VTVEFAAGDEVGERVLLDEREEPAGRGELRELGLIG